MSEMRSALERRPQGLVDQVSQLRDLAMKQMTIKILGKGDTLVEYRPDRLIIRTKKGEYLVYNISEDAEGYPRLNMDKVVKIAQGKGTIEFYDSETQITIRR